MPVVVTSGDIEKAVQAVEAGLLCFAPAESRNPVGRADSSLAAGGGSPTRRRRTVAIALFSRCACRKDFGPLFARLKDPHSRSLARREATPTERLEHLIELFNETDKPDPSTSTARAFVRRLLAKVETLMPHPPSERIG